MRYNIQKIGGAAIISGAFLPSMAEYVGHD